MKKESVFTTKRIARIAILSAVATVLMMFDFPLPFIAPPFYKIDFSEVAVLIGGFAMGPWAAVMIEFLKIVLNLLFTSTQTMFVGELSNFIVGCAFCVPATIIYQKHKTKATALKGLIVGTLTMTAIGFLTNFFFIIPAYVAFTNFTLDQIIGMASAIFPFINSKFLLVLCCTTPFNLIKGVIVSLFTVLLYKHISPLLKVK